jgi:hypothetical protein
MLRKISIAIVIFTIRADFLLAECGWKMCFILFDWMRINNVNRIARGMNEVFVSNPIRIKNINLVKLDLFSLLLSVFKK